MALASGDSVAGGSSFRAPEGTFTPNASMRIKYARDRLAGVLLLLFLFPFGLLVAAVITIEAIAARERPTVFMSERRLSAANSFRLLKFRTVRVRSLQYDLENPNPRSIKALESPEHLTWIGRFLKRFYLDEIPQLLNIARGEMSLVGPRPYFAGDWTREPLLDIPARRRLKAGLVGPFQAVKGGVSGLDSVNVIDTEYLEFCLTASPFALFRRDLDLIRRSLRTLARGEGL